MDVRGNPRGIGCMARVQLTSCSSSAQRFALTSWHYSPSRRALISQLRAAAHGEDQEDHEYHEDHAAHEEGGDEDGGVEYEQGNAQ